MAFQRFCGTVSWYDAARGFGFIRRDDGAADVFVGRRTLQACGMTELRVGDRVDFGIERGRNGKFHAVNIIKLAAASGESV